MTGATAADGADPFRKPRLAAFPKAFFHQLLAGGPMSIEDFIRRAPGLGLEGVELYPGFLGGTDDGTLTRLLRVADDVGVELPMMCSSPDFIDPRPGAWEGAVDKMRELVDVMTVLAPRSSWRSVRVLSGQAWPGVPEDEGIRRAVEGIQAVIAYAAPKQISVVMENHYKDGLWEYPEFALTSRRFLAIVEQLGSPWFGINFDPSNAIVAGEDPLDLLDRVVGRVRSMGASDRSLRAGYSLEDLQAHRGQGYSEALLHGVVGQGLNDYPTILSRLAQAGFGGWISIEDGEAGGEQGYLDIAASARFLAELVDRYWPEASSQKEALFTETSAASHGGGGRDD